MKYPQNEDKMTYEFRGALQYHITNLSGRNNELKNLNVGPNLHVFLDFLLVEFSADQTLCGVKRVRGVGDCLTLGGHADKTFALW